ncbi:MAG: hypothetical protein DRI90_05185 [Deltaproteobacteria bacterium]|nr:MAG: hypothetical protein DRI90_05185 [Deltaproteobacteria bacterium]
MADSGLESINIVFFSAGLPEDDIRLAGLLGQEELSRPFSCRLILVRPAGPFSDEQLDTLMTSHCAVAMGPDEADVVQGILSEIQLIDAARTVAARYLCTMVPTVSTLGLARSCRIYQDQTTAEIIETVLTLYGLKKGEDFDNRVRAKLPKREYVVQYQESDWAFLERQMERDGIFYWFDHNEQGETLIIADENSDATPIGDPHIVSYRERNNLSTGGASTVWDWQLLQKRVPARVGVIDYNYRTPGVPLVGEAKVGDEGGFGSVTYYGEHFKTTDEGTRIAQLRAEQLACGRRTYSGRTDCPRFRVGHTFELENHHDAQHDGEYLITSMEHRVGQPVRTGDVDDYQLSEDPQRYIARFTAIPVDVPYRPERRTPWPRINGVMHAHIAGDTSGENAEIDDQGRYKVRLPFDVTNPGGSKASRWVRKAQPYTGGGYGQHFPLHKGTEVLLVHTDGDPDRPIIVGAVPNPQTLSPSTGANATQSVLQTASGIRFEMEDQA